MTNQELQARVEAISMAAFHQPFRHRAIFNARLKTTGGRFHPADMNLDFNPKLFAAYPPAITDGIIKHELVHYHLYAQHCGYQHRDHDFRQLLAAVGGSRFAPPLPTTGRQYAYVCTQCGRQFIRRRRIDVRRYACGHCRGKLRLQKTVIS
ncbi:MULTISPECIES: SprT family protein [Lacticaseibacillus]|nr:SprT family protein [Lacticaseibacillus casei]MBI6597160.1 SprT family protein [Lacticaseibacillus casei]MBO1480856.1 SprT family protein [Lacticaseibacillus casei]MBO2416135.1 SprT family protein [Lacticaseibacillus casei]MCK2080623.1 SprT family protein [Lacticaseibacillus casei]MDZ5496944.1 SprT family protein [Lacticaseibacillus casei]